MKRRIRLRRRDGIVQPDYAGTFSVRATSVGCTTPTTTITVTDCGSYGQ